MSMMETFWMFTAWIAQISFMVIGILLVFTLACVITVLAIFLYGHIEDEN